eukprot:506699-Pyramimonas_sp.AAC.1
MANQLGIESDGETGADEKPHDEKILTETEALDCLAALVARPRKPRTWGEAGKTAAYQKTNRG